ncbi:hypothetical protein Y032_0620g740 [Ancylostoma ceylanicum]|uniref:Cation transporter family protein n=1 Tax=Ancylostoma ceylanicum TaxID=53326 RepID=A0A016WMN2_9BILA|nr:hypothetical protein Y032_0620g740 [Ancylostoma ceylanicum]
MTYYCKNLHSVLLTTAICTSFASFRGGQLYTKLLENYEPLERPVANSSEPVDVKMGLVLQQIVSVDEKNQVVDVNAWLKLSWYDYSLTWDPKKFDGVADLRFKKNQLWTPDVLLYNSADPQFDSSFQSNLLVYPDGLVNWIPPGIFRISCRIAVAWFPFDLQECFMKFGSWTFDGTKLNLEVDQNGFDLSSYTPNGEWELLDTFVKRNIQHYQCCPEPYYDIVFTFIIRRRVLYYAFNLILPCILITVLTLTGFTLPPDAGEKMSLQITIMLSICIFQNYLSEMSPPTSEAVPFLGAYFAVCMFTCACCVVATTLALNFHHRSSYSHEMNEMFRQLMLNWLPWLLMMHRPGYTADKGQMVKMEEDEEDQRKPVICIESLLSKMARPSAPKLTIANECEPRGVEERRHLWQNSSKRLPERSVISSKQVTQEQITQLLLLREIHENLSAITEEIRVVETNKAVEDDWKFAAMVVDRLCLFIFSTFILFSTFGCFSSVPDLRRFM